MTNIDFDHPDYFANIDDVFSAFQEMAVQVKKGIFAYGDDGQLQKSRQRFLFCFTDLVKKMTIKPKILLKQQVARALMFLFAILFMTHLPFLRLVNIAC